jgi:Leucine-rich repeat (LRR) protein
MKKVPEAPSIDSSKNLILSHSKWQQLLAISQPFQIETLDVSHNSLTPQDVATFPSLPRLQKLDLSHNALTSAFDIAVLFEKFPQLRVCSLSENNLSAEWKIQITGAGGNIFTAQKYITIQSLDLSGNKLKSLVFESELPLLQALDVSNNILEYVSGLQNVKALTKLNLAGNKLSFLSHEMAALQLLQELDCSGNMISRYFWRPP